MCDKGLLLSDVAIAILISLGPYYNAMDKFSIISTTTPSLCFH